jgi:hypothetical protein
MIFLFFKILYNLVWKHPANYIFLQKRILFHASKVSENQDNPGLNFKRLKYYNRVTSIFYTCLEHLIGTQLSSKQIESASLFCGITPMLDDLMDEENYSDEEINLLVNKILPRNTLEERICIGLFDDLSERVGDIRSHPVFQSALAYQLKSRAQSDKTALTFQEIEQITLKKGGYSFLLSLQVIAPDLLNDPRIEAAVFHLGATVQLTNDIYDIYKDRESGLQTLLTTTSNMNAFRAYFEKYIAETQGLIENLPYTKQRKKTLLFQYNGMLAFARVALNQLQDNQGQTEGIFRLELYSRSQLVCDMHQWGNQKLVLNYLIFGT